MAKNCRREMGWGRGALDNLRAMPHKVLRSFVDRKVRSRGRGQVPAAFEGAGVVGCVAMGGSQCLCTISIGKNVQSRNRASQICACEF